MRLLDRYLLRELMTPLFYCLCGFLIFWISFDLFSELSDFQKEGMSVLEIAHYYVITAPELLVVVLPVALLLGLLYALTTHARHNELAAMRSAGVSLMRISLPYLAVGLCFTGGLFALNELWVPQSYDAARELRSRRLNQESPGQGRWEQNLHFRNARDGRIWSIQAFNLDTSEMRAPQITWHKEDGTRRSLIATNAVWTNGVWLFQDVREFDYPSLADSASPSQEVLPESTQHAPALSIPELSETPVHIRSELKIRSFDNLKAARHVQLSIAEILGYLRLHPDLHPKTSQILRTRLHERIAAPWTCLVVVLIAFPFGAPSGRRNVFAGVASSIFICFAFFVMTRVSLALGAGGHLPPWIAAWLPNAVFALAGLALARRVA